MIQPSKPILPLELTLIGDGWEVPFTYDAARVVTVPFIVTAVDIEGEELRSLSQRLRRPFYDPRACFSGGVTHPVGRRYTIATDGDSALLPWERARHLQALRSGAGPLTLLTTAVDRSQRAMYTGCHLLGTPQVTRAVSEWDYVNEYYSVQLELVHISEQRRSP